MAHRLGQDEAYFTVREILAEASTTADEVLWRKPGDFSRCGYGNVRVTPGSAQTCAAVVCKLPLRKRE